MNNTEKKLYGKKAGRIMKTDIKERIMTEKQSLPDIP